MDCALVNAEETDGSYAIEEAEHEGDVATGPEASKIPVCPVCQCRLRQQQKHPDRARLFNLVTEVRSALRSEVTEACAVLDKARAATALAQLQDAGVLGGKAIRLTSSNRYVSPRDAAGDSIDEVETQLKSLLETLPKNTPRRLTSLFTSIVLPMYNLGWRELVESMVRQKMLITSSTLSSFLAYIVERDDVVMAKTLLAAMSSPLSSSLTPLFLEEMVRELLRDCCLRGRFQMAHALLLGSNTGPEKIAEVARTLIRVWATASSREGKGSAVLAIHWAHGALIGWGTMRIITPGGSTEQVEALMASGCEMDVRGVETTLATKILQTVTGIVDFEISNAVGAWPEAMSSIVSLFMVGLPGTEAQESAACPLPQEPAACRSMDRYGMYLRHGDPKAFESLVAAADGPLYSQLFQSQVSATGASSSSSSVGPTTGMRSAPTQPVYMRILRPLWWDIRMRTFMRQCGAATRKAIRGSFDKWISVSR